MGWLLFQWLAFALTLGVVIYLGWKKPEALLPLLVIAVALEISRTWYPSFGDLGTALGTVALARIVTFGIIISAGIRVFTDWKIRYKFLDTLTEPLTIALIIYIAVGLISVSYSIDRSKTIVEVIRIGTLFLLFLGSAALAKTDYALLPFKVAHAVGVILFPLSIYQAASRNFLWQHQLSVGMIARVNTTFVDPNIFARFIVIAIVANLVLQFNTTNRSKRFIYFFSLIALITELAVTLSRSGMLTLGVIILAFVIFYPKKQVLIPVGFLGVIAAALLAMRPTVLQRLLTLKNGFNALDEQRQYLIKAAWDMFQTHKAAGIGLGGYQKLFLTKYISLKTVPDGATLSHTTILTIAAELGTIGLLALGVIWATLLQLLFRIKKSISENYLIGLGYFLWIVTVFISSQAEARFFEDPIIWLSMGFMVELLRSERMF